MVFNDNFNNSSATDSGQKYSDASSFLYIFHINLQFNFFLFWNQFMSDFDNFLIDTSKIESISTLFYKTNILRKHKLNTKLNLFHPKHNTMIVLL
jgi:hypothetical protein